MRVVFDTNILISSLLWPGSHPSRVVDLARHRRVKNLISSSILAEFRRVLEKKFDFAADIIESAVEILLDHSEIVKLKGRPIGNVLRDAEDAHILDCAHSGEADWIITGDKDLLALGEFRRIHIVTAKDFLVIYKKAT